MKSRPSKGTHFIFLLITAVIGQNSRVLAGSVICPTYYVQPGDSLTSIAAAQALDVAALRASISACNGQPDSLQAGQTICLPGGDNPACANVKTQNGNPICKYYIIQAGESISTTAYLLNLYLPDVQALNPGLSTANLQVGDLVKLPGWNDKTCGYLPSNIGQISSASVAPPPPLLYPPPPGQINSQVVPPSPPVHQNNSPINNNSPNLSTVVSQAPPSQNAAPSQNCRAFKAREQDTLYTIADLFKIDVTLLVQANPDLGAGAVVTAGMIVKIPPYDPTCAMPQLVDPSTLSAPAPVQVNQPVPVNAGSGVPIAAPAPFSSDITSQLPQEVTQVPSQGNVDTINGVPSNQVYAGSTNSASTSTRSATPATPAPNNNSSSNGNIVIAVCLFFSALAMLAMFGLALSGTAPYIRNSLKSKKGEENLESAV